MKLSRVCLVAAAGAVGLLAQACEHNIDSTTTSTTSGLVINDPTDLHAVDTIGFTRCEREARCGNIGPDRSFRTSASCIRHLRADALSELTIGNCRAGISQTELDECLADIRASSCEMPIEKLSTVPSCRTRELCPPR
ncbi:MAG TPA: DUF6184 family natural product biosynthesis lipoprotein [Polyangiaceae bacterium]